jgi:hypothetical protein
MQAPNPSVVDHKNGQYTVEFSTPAKGLYLLHVHLGEEALPGSPFRFDV